MSVALYHLFPIGPLKLQFNNNTPSFKLWLKEGYKNLLINDTNFIWDLKAVFEVVGLQAVVWNDVNLC